MMFDWTEDPLAEGLRCYRAHRFFEAHEHWEEVWLKCQDPEKKFLQALIQVTVAFHHLQRNNRAGAMRQLTAALRKLELYPDGFGGVKVAKLCESIRAWIAALEQGDAPEMPVPEIR